MNTVIIEGDKILMQKLADIKRTAPEKLKGLLSMGASVTEAEAVSSINAHKSSGVTYARGKVSHTASAAGSPPNTDKGDLVRNITTQEITNGYDVGSRAGAPHGLWLEFGTLKILPRPWLLPAYRVAVEKVTTAIKGLKL